MPFQDFDDLPINWADHEDVAMKLYERFGAEFTESKIYRIRFTELIEWILEIPNFEGKREDSNESHLEQIQARTIRYGALCQKRQKLQGFHHVQQAIYGRKKRKEQL